MQRGAQRETLSVIPDYNDVLVFEVDAALPFRGVKHGSFESIAPGYVWVLRIDQHADSGKPDQAIMHVPHPSREIAETDGPPLGQGVPRRRLALGEEGHVRSELVLLHDALEVHAYLGVAREQPGPVRVQLEREGVVERGDVTGRRRCGECWGQKSVSWTHHAQPGLSMGTTGSCSPG